MTAFHAVLDAGLDLIGLDLDRQLGNAAFFGHWKIPDFLLARGASVAWTKPDTGKTALYSAPCKAGRPHYGHVVRLLPDAGADPNARTITGREPVGFMRDVRTRGETYPTDHGQGWGGMEARMMGDCLPPGR